MVEESPPLVPVEKLSSEPYRQILAYPSPNDDIVEDRVRQLTKLGVSTIEFTGPLRIGRLSVLGKGVVGMVVAGVVDDRKVALKVRRVDSRRSSMNHEAVMTRAANSVGVGPEYLGSTNDVLMMEFVEGMRLPMWLSSLRGRGRRVRVRSTLGVLLQQCVKLDAYGLDHGELSRAHKNVLVSSGDRPWILDFESASLMRRVNNFTSLGQYLFLSRVFARKLARVLGPIDEDDLVKHLRLYKSGLTNDALEATMKLLNP